MEKDSLFVVIGHGIDYAAVGLLHSMLKEERDRSSARRL